MDSFQTEAAREIARLAAAAVDTRHSKTRRQSGHPHLASLAGLAVMMLTVSGCHHRTQARVAPPPALAPPIYTQPSTAPQPQAPPPARIPITPVPTGVTAEDLDYIATHHPILTQVGYATWYTAPYRGRKAANGQVFSDDAMTAAHRTLPLGALILVTNLTTGQSAAMRINDRGPFVEDRVLDMTVASARATGIYRAGLAQVRIDVYETPKSINTGGRWCVQIGAFHSERDAIRLKNELLRTYAESNVIEFPGENSYWVRIRPEGDDRQTAEYIANHLRLSEGTAYLTRLD